MAIKPSRTDTVESGDSFVLYQSNNDDYRLVSQQGLIDFFNNNVASSKPLTQRFAPNATGFNAIISTITGQDTHLILTPLAGYAAGTITLPLTTTLKDKQTLLVNTTQAVTTLTIALNGATAAPGAPTTLTANAYFTLKYDLTNNTWYRVG